MKVPDLEDIDNFLKEMGKQSYLSSFYEKLLENGYKIEPPELFNKLEKLIL